jgi:CubicO group peptidase (beta-lactamase class C family)
MREALLAFILLTAACQSAPAANGMRGSGLAAELDPVIDAAVADGFAGQVAIMRGGALVYVRAAGFADLAGIIPVTNDTLFHVASLTKYFTAALTLKAVEDGRLSLDSPASTVFAGTKLAERDFTIGDVLSHRSGLRSTYAAETTHDASAALDAIAAANAANLKDSAFHYANDGYDLLAILLERLYAQPYESLFRAMLAAPAALQHFAFWGEAALTDPLVRSQPLEAHPAALLTRNYGLIGSAGLLITAADLVHWQQALQTGRVLSGEALAELYKPRESVSIGETLYGSFLIESPRLGPAISARGAEDWGDNAYLNDYTECGFIVAIVTSRGPAEGSGKPLFRDRLIEAIEGKLASRCAARFS